MSNEETAKKIKKLMWQYLGVNLLLIAVFLWLGSMLPENADPLGIKLAFVGSELLIALVFYRRFTVLMSKYRRGNRD